MITQSTLKYSFAIHPFTHTFIQCIYRQHFSPFLLNFVSSLLPASTYDLPSPVACCCSPSSSFQGMMASGTNPALLLYCQSGLLPARALGQEKGAPGRCPLQAAGTVSALKLVPYWGVLAWPVDWVHLGQRGSGKDHGNLGMVLGCERGASYRQSQGWVVKDWECSRLGAWTCTELREGACWQTRRM